MDYGDYSIDRLSVEILRLIDKVRETKVKIRKTPFYRILTLYELYKELKEIDKDTDKIGEMLKKFEREPIKIICRQ